MAKEHGRPSVNLAVSRHYGMVMCSVGMCFLANEV